MYGVSNARLVYIPARIRGCGLVSLLFTPTLSAFCMRRRVPVNLYCRGGNKRAPSRSMRSLGVPELRVSAHRLEAKGVQQQHVLHHIGDFGGGCGAECRPPPRPTTNATGCSSTGGRTWLMLSGGPPARTKTDSAMTSCPLTSTGTNATSKSRPQHTATDTLLPQLRRTGLRTTPRRPLRLVPVLRHPRRTWVLRAGRRHHRDPRANPCHLQRTDHTDRARRQLVSSEAAASP